MNANVVNDNEAQREVVQGQEQIRSVLKNPTNANNLEFSPLKETFYIQRRKCNVKIVVKLTPEGIYLCRESHEHEQVHEEYINIMDIVGAYFGSRIKKGLRNSITSCRRSQEDVEDNQSGANTIKTNSESSLSLNANGTPSKDTSVYLYIYAYIKREKPSLRRLRTVRILRFRSFERYEENFKIAERWYLAIKDLKGAGKSQEELKKPLLILLNPKSGSGKGRTMFHQQMAPILKEAEMPYDLQVTTHANFAYNLMKTRNDLAKRYSGVVVASGDGLFYEVLNGLMERRDWFELSRQLPLGIVPCGSGNGLAASLAYLYKEPYEPKPIMNATLACVSRCTAKMHVVKVESAQKEMFSFLSVGWGLLADVDIESERLRSLGAPRFTLWTIHRLLSLRTYKGKLSYLPWRGVPTSNLQVVTCPQQTTREHADLRNNPVDEVAEEVVELRHQGQSLPSEQYHDIPEEDEETYADAISHMSFRTNIDSWSSAISRRTAYYSVGGQSIRSQRSVTASIISERLKDLNSEQNQQGIPGQLKSLPAQEPQSDQPPAQKQAFCLKSTIPPLGMPLPDNTWQFEEGEFILVHAAYTTHLAADCLFAPDSRLNDGIIYLVIIRAGVGRQQLLQFLLNMSNGTHLPTAPNPHIQLVPVRAFRIEPAGSEGIITVDGERVPYGPVQAEIFPNMINVMVPGN